MAKQIQINLRLGGDSEPADLDRIIYEATQLIQSRIPCKIFGYGVVDVPSPEQSRFKSDEPATADVIHEVAAPIRMMEHLL